MKVLSDWLLTPARAAIHVPTMTAVIADLHLGYAEARNRSGEAVPNRNVSQILTPLKIVLKKHSVTKLIVAGDLMEMGRPENVIQNLLQWLAQNEITLQAVVPGNHDRGLSRAGGQLPIVEEGVTLGDWQIVHGDQDLPEGKVVQGHLHPCLRWGRGQASPCFLAKEDHLVLPAFSEDASGMDVRRNPKWKAYSCYAVASDRVLALGELSTKGK